MRREICLAIVASAALVLFSQVGLAQMSSASYVISDFAISSGSGNLSSTNYEAQLTLGQPVIGNASGSDYEACFGIGCLGADNTPPFVSCADCDSPDPVSSDGTLTFSPEVFDGESGVKQVDVCGDAACSQVLCTNTAYVNPGLTETRTCTVGNFATCSVSKNVTYWVRTVDAADNIRIIEGGNYTVLKAGGCGCATSDECASGACVAGICSFLTPPELTIDVDTPIITVALGQTGSFLVRVKNPLDAADTIEAHIIGEPSKIGAWSWWSGHRFDAQKLDTFVELEPGSEAILVVEILGGQITTGGEKITVWLESRTTGLRARDSRGVQIVSVSPEGVLQAPDLSFFAFFTILAAAALLARRHGL